MNNTKYIYFFRHGETNLNVEEIVMGQNKNLITTFTEKGYEQIEELAHNLIKYSIEIIYCSDMQRCIDTVTIANKDSVLPVIISEEIRGLNMGILQGQRISNFSNNEYAKDSFNDHNIPFKNGESINQLNFRIINFIKNIYENSNYNHIAVITHSAAISNLVSYLMNEKYVSYDSCLVEVINDNINLLQYSNSKNKKIILRKKF